MCILRRNILEMLQLGTQPRWCLATGTGVSILGHVNGDTARDGELEPDVKRWSRTWQWATFGSEIRIFSFHVGPLV